MSNNGLRIGYRIGQTDSPWISPRMGFVMQKAVGEVALQKENVVSPCFPRSFNGRAVFLIVLHEIAIL